MRASVRTSVVALAAMAVAVSVTPPMTAQQGDLDPIDDYVFGVAALDAARHESSVSAYVSPPRGDSAVKTKGP